MKNLYLILLFCALLLSGVSFAQDSPDDAPRTRITAWKQQPIATDELFVNGDGDDFKKYLFRKDKPNGRLRYTVNVTRFYSDLMKFNSQGFLTNANELIERGLLPGKVKFTMLVYDVDHNSQIDENEDGIPEPEVDHVWVNGTKIITDSGDAWTLGSGNEQFSPASIDIPVQLLKFPQKAGSGGGAPTPAENIIEIDIDVTLTTHWAVRCDWISVSVPSVQPVVLVHGLKGGADTWKIFASYLKTDNIPYEIVTNQNFGCGSISANSAYLEEQIIKVRKSHGVDKVNLVVHSKGGLDSRQYLRRNGGSQVENLIQLGTPNHGSGIAHLYPEAYAGCYAQVQLDPDWLADNFNYFKKITPLYNGEKTSGTKISLLIGIEENFWQFNEYGDGWVSAKRATLPWRAKYDGDLTEPENIANDGEYNTSHSGLHDSHKIYADIINGIISPEFNIKSKQRIGTVEPKTARTFATDSLTLVYVEKQTLAASNATTWQAYIPASKSGLFQILFEDKTGVYTLESPSGKVYSITSPEYSTQDVFENSLLTYFIPNIEKGIWKFKIKNGSKGGFVSARVSILSNKILTVQADAASLVINQPIALQATFTQAGSPVIGSIMYAFTTQGSVKDSVQLFDDAKHGDAKAGDGIYGNQIKARTEAGAVSLVIRAQQGTELVFKETTITISPVSGEFTKKFSESVVDSDLDGYYDVLKVDVGFNVKQAGHYQVSAVLTDSKDKVFTSASWDSMSGGKLSTGSHTATLNFSGIDIGKNGVDGPYKLDGLVLTDLTYDVPVAYLAKPFTTRYYDVNKFPRPVVELTGKNKEVPVDEDKDGRIDYLDITIEVNVNYADYYSMNAELIDSLQNSLNWAQGTKYLSKGINQIVLRFDGQEINEKLKSGRFILNNLFFLSDNNSTSFGSVTFYNVLRTRYYSFNDFTGNSITGTVKDETNGTAAANAMVILRGPKLATVQTDAAGKFAVAGLPDGSYYIQATKEGFCSSDSISLVLPSQKATFDLTIFNLSKPVITSDQALKLTSSNATGNQWYKDGKLIPGATSQTYQVTEPGRYSVSVSRKKCSAVSGTLDVVITAVENPSVSAGLQLFPNPGTDFVTLSYFSKKSTRTVKIDIYDIRGVRMGTEAMSEKSDGIMKSVLDIRAYPAGRYIIQLQDADTIIAYAFIKQ